MNFAITPEKAQKMAKARDSYEARKWPLFAAAGLIERNEPESFIEQAAINQMRWDRTIKRLERRARLLRFLVTRNATAEQIQRLEKRLRALPSTAEYRADFWRSRLLERLSGKEWINYQKIFTGDCERGVA
jgi:hypothetical protein